MKAIQFERFGGPEVLELVDVAVPEVGPDQLLVKVASAGVNLADTLIRENRYAFAPPLPSIPGSEVAGVVERVGKSVSGFSAGERVIAPLFAINIQFGGYAEYVVVDAEWAVRIPQTVTFDVAVALSVQGLAAYYLVSDRALKNKTVMVSAAAGGVGSLLVQLVKKAGAKTVIAAASSDEKRAYTKSIGADATIDYTRPDWTEALLQATDGVGPDVIFESVGGDVMRQALQALAPRGEIVIYGALNIQDFSLGIPELLGMIFKNQSLSGFATAPLLTPENLARSLNELFAMVAAGELQVKIGGSYPLEKVAEAHAALQSRGTIGKIVLQP